MSRWVLLGPTRLSIPSPTATLSVAALGTRVWWFHGCYHHPWWEEANLPSPCGMARAPPAPHSTPRQRDCPGPSPSRGAVAPHGSGLRPGLSPPWAAVTDARGHTAPETPHPISSPRVLRAGVPRSSPGASPGAEGRRDEQLLCALLKGALCTPGPPAPSATRHRRHGHPPCPHLAACAPPSPEPPAPTLLLQSREGGAQPQTVATPRQKAAGKLLEQTPNLRCPPPPR